MPTFRGAAAKLDLRTGRLLWTTYMAPAFNNSNSSTYFPGSAVWGAVPQVDRKRGTVGTGAAGRQGIAAHCTCNSVLSRAARGAVLQPGMSGQQLG